MQWMAECGKMSGITAAAVIEALREHNQGVGPNAATGTSTKKHNLDNQLSTLAVYLPFSLPLPPPTPSLAGFTRHRPRQPAAMLSLREGSCQGGFL
jgi:hypothetical protein